MASYKAIELKILQFMFLGRNSKIETRDLFRPSKSPSKLFFSAFRPISLEHFGTVGRKGDATTIYRSARFFIRFTNNIGTPIREMDVPNGQSILETYSDPRNRPRNSFSAFRPISLEHFGTVVRKGDATTIYRSARFFIRFTNNIGTPIREMDVPNGQSILETYSDPRNRPRVSFFLQVWIDLSEPLVAKWTQQQSIVFFYLNSIH